MQLKFLFISVFIKTETALITFELNFSSCLFISILKTSNGVSLVEFSKINFSLKIPSKDIVGVLSFH